ncbi:hypothetical protein CEUSTIGMA_g1224.t1 [Chlamydomonas eustigma]|uniref:Mitochondrial carrier protein n=1 Tax=Chlamydomonas eustigma TaxID=1157962 RepID=A0A250WSG8_9CHLO|nr:hypothetical protein CEUSTIGMA_g1224.t1 [Chlamydomonas eustigma]|eukprot:GAX73773.1 hypothetical protein CEUSTIGMA_g1224.t1 [Chlamydomonas eustigma]
MSMDDRPARLSASSIDFISGAIAGALSIATTQPLDMIRIRMQTLASSSLSHAAPIGRMLSTSGAITPAPRNESFRLLTCMVRKEGFLSPYKGMSFPLLFTSFQSAVIFQVYGATLRSLEVLTASKPGPVDLGDNAHTGRMSPKRKQPSFVNTFVAGCTAGLVQAYMMSPIEMLKIQMQVQTAPMGNPQYKGPLRMLRHLLRSEGISGLYRGVTVTAYRDIPSYGLYFVCYRLLASTLEPEVVPEEACALTQVLAGGSAGCLAWISVYPLDVIKSRIQAAPKHDSHLNWIHYGQAMYREGGLAAMFRGIKPTLARAFVMDAITFVGYTNVLRWLTFKFGAETGTIVH